jgi:hypothetical protein
MAGAFLVLLLGVHAFLGVWGLIGFAEWFSDSTPWPRVSNPLFPRDILLMQWSLVLAASVLFIGGHALRWEHTPAAMACVYAAMAALCAVQTFTWLKGDLRFVAMGAEYAAYAVILLFLFRRGSGGG